MTAGKQNVIEINCNRLYRQFPFSQTVIPVWICFTSNQIDCVCIPYYNHGFIVIKFFSVEEYKKADPSNIAMTEAGRVPSTNPLDNLDCKYMSSGISNSSMYPGISVSKNGGVKRKKYI